MEIEFNPNRVTNSTAAQPAAKASAPATTQDSASLDKTSALMAAINNVPLTRPDRVQSARAAVSTNQFPPDEILKAVAALIAENIQ